MKPCHLLAFAAVALCATQAFAANTHTVTFRRMNGTVLSKVEVEHGANASSLAPALPAETDMTAKGWDHADWLTSVTNDVTCWALYEAATAKSPSTSITSQSVANRETPYSLDEYFQIYDNLAWSDEFSGSSLDVGRWGGMFGGNWQYDTGVYNREIETYTQGPNQEVSDGTLKIICKRESSTRITSSKIVSKGKVAFLKGRCEIRAKVTKAYGAFPAFWTMGSNHSWPAGGEIDIFEQLNGSDWITGTLHMPRYQNSTDQSYESCGGSVVVSEDGVHWGDGFHRIGVIVNERDLVWYVDDHIFQRMDIRDSKYDVLRSDPQYILLNYAFGGTWSGVTNMNMSAAQNFTSENFEIDYCRIFTNTNANNTVARAESAGAQLSGPVKATVWRGWQMNWGKSGSNYYMNHLTGKSGDHNRKALREYLGRDNADIVTFLTRIQADTGSDNLRSPYDVPGYTSIFLSPNSGRSWTDWDRDIREKLLSAVIFNKNRFSQSDSSVGTLQLSNDYSFTNGCAVVAELVEKETGAKVKVVSALVSSTVGANTSGSVAAQGFSTLISKLNSMKDEKVVLLLQGWTADCLNYIDSKVNSELSSSYSKLGQYTHGGPDYQYQSAWATASYQASAEQPAPLKLGTSNTYTNQSYCATIQFEAPPAIDYGQLDMSGFAKKMTVTFSGAQSGTTLTDFPVLVKLSTAINGFSYSDFKQSNGADLRFADSTGKLLPHEIDTWNPSGVSTVWVKVPSLTKDTTITACWGKTGDLPEVAVKDVWDDDYVGVWHLGESALPLKESSETSSDFTTSKGSGIGYAATGVVGGSVDFGESGNSRSVVAPDHAALDGFTACTFEAWTYIDATARSYKKDGTDSAKGLLTKRTGYGNQASYHLWDTGSGTSVCVSSNSTSHTQITGISNVPAGEWVHQVVTFNAGSVANYKGGASAGAGTTDVKKVNAGDANLHLGNFQAGDTRNFPGKVDELRISKVARSAAWVKATHDTIAEANFATYAVDGVAPVVHDPVLVVTVGAGVTNTLSAITNVTSATWITNVVKRGAGTLVASGMPPGFSGLISVEAGVWQGGADASDFGGAGTVIDVKDGASLALRGATTNGLASAALSGKTVNLYGAKEANTRGKIYVYNDATTTIGPNVTIRLKDSDSTLYLDCAAWRVFYISSGTIDLGGHKLSVSSNYRRLETGATITNGGTFELVYTELYVADNSRIPTFSGTGTLKTNYAINLKKLVSATGWTLSGSPVTLHGNVNRQPTSTDYPVWSGPVSFSGNSKVSDYDGASSGTSNTVFNLKGAVSGSGTLKVGPGWLNLHSADNTYSGAVTVNGRSAQNAAAPILPGGGGIGLWNGAACFPNASSIIFTNTARLAFMDATACSVPNVKFVALAGETQSVSGGVDVARSTMAGFVKEGAGTLYFDAAVDVTGIGDVKAGTLKVANRINLDDAADQAAVLASTTVFSNLQFAAGTTFDLSDAPISVLNDLTGAPSITNVGVAAISGKWTLPGPNNVMNVTGENIMLFGGNVSGGLAFIEGATFDLADEAAFSNAVASAGDRGILVAYANWVVIDEFAGIPAPMPQPSANISQRWQMYVDPSNVRELRLRFAPAGGYAAWVSEKGLTGDAAAFDKETNGIKNGIRYAFDIDPASSTVGDPIIKVVFDSNGNPVVESRNLADGRDDVTFGVLATENLNDWTSATLVPMEKFPDGFWKPADSKNNSSYVFPSKMFFKYQIDIR